MKAALEKSYNTINSFGIELRLLEVINFPTVAFTFTLSIRDQMTNALWDFCKRAAASSPPG